MVVTDKIARDPERAWGHELEVQIRRRAFWFSCALIINLIFEATGWGHSTTAVVAVLSLWLAMTGVLEWLRRRLELASHLLTLSGMAFCLDVAFVTATMYLMGGGWWIGTACTCVIVAVAGGSLPRNWSATVLVCAIVSYAGLLLGQSIGSLSPTPWFALPSLRAYPQLAVTAIVINTLAMVALWSLSRFLVGRINRSRQRYRQVVEAAPYMILTLDMSARVRNVNSATLQSTGYCLAEMHGRGLLRFVAREDRPRVMDAFHAALDGQEVRLEHRFRTADGQMRWLAVTYVPVHGPTNIASVLVMARDLTHERRAAEHQTRLERDLAASQRMELVGRLVSGVAHELNNPLAAVLTFTEQLLHDASPGSDAHALRIVHEQALRARAIVRDLLEVARNRSDRPRETAALSTIVHGVVEGMSHSLTERDIDVQVRECEGVPRLHVDTTGIAQVMANLIRNAAHASPVGGTIGVRIRLDGEWVAIDVEDQGAGIRGDVMPHLFEPFFTTKPPGQGTGLGLAVSKGIVEQNGGTLIAENGAIGSGVGARLTLRLPRSLAFDVTSSDATDTMRADGVMTFGDTDRQDADRDVALDAVFPATAVPTHESVMTGAPPREVERAAAPGIAPHHGLPDPSVQLPRLLLVDDEESIRLALERWLGRHGWIVESCANGQAALDVLLKPDALSRYDAIVCDLKMPGVSGVQLYNRLCEEQPDLIHRLILATGDVASVDVARFLATVQCPVLEKPFELRVLDETLARLRALH